MPWPVPAGSWPGPGRGASVCGRCLTQKLGMLSPSLVQTIPSQDGPLSHLRLRRF
jgi:hypothetical protein